MRLPSSIVLSVLAAVAACSAFDSVDPPPELPERDASVALDADSADVTEVDAADAAVPDAPTASADYEAAVLADAPIAYWRFTEPVGSPALASKVGKHDLVPSTNALPLLGRPGLFSGTGGAIELDNTPGQRAAVGGLPILVPNAFAVEMWIFLPQPANLNGRSLLVHSDGQRSYFVYLEGPKINLRVTGPVGQGQVVATGPGDGAWHHLVFQANAPPGSEIYLDAIKWPLTTTVQAGAYNVRDFILGASDPGSNTVSALLAEVALYDHVLASERITEHFKVGKRP